VMKHLILGQYSSILTPVAWALHFTMVTSKSWLQEILRYLKPFGRVCTFTTEYVIHHLSVVDHFQYYGNQCITSKKIGDKLKPY
jgi:hypothetical protein